MLSPFDALPQGYETRWDSMMNRDAGLLLDDFLLGLETRWDCTKPYDVASFDALPQGQPPTGNGRC